MENKNSKGAVTTGILAAFAASSCCIPPVVAAIAGAGGASINLSWMEPFRPYLIGLTIVAIGYAWYNHIKQKKEDDCGCDIEKQKWHQTKGFLVGMTLFAIVSISFPYYSGVFFPDNKKEVIVSDNANIQKITIGIEGMTCDACQSHVDHAVNELEGIVDVKSSYANRNAIVEFDNTRTTQEEIKKAVNSTGYEVTKIEKE